MSSSIPGNAGNTPIRLPDSDFSPSLQKKMLKVTALDTSRSAFQRMVVLERGLREKLCRFEEGRKIYREVLRHYPEFNVLSNRLIALEQTIEAKKQEESLKKVWKKIAEVFIDNGTGPFQIKRISQVDKINEWMNAPGNSPCFNTLTSLDLSGLNLVTLPHELFLSSRLQFLYLDRNQLKHIPQHIKELKELRALHLAFNQLRGLPEELAPLPLETLRLDHNRLTKSPPFLENIAQVSLADNPVVKSGTLPPKLLKQAIADENLERTWMSFKSEAYLKCFNFKRDTATEIRWWMGKNEKDLGKITKLNLSTLSLTEVPRELLIYCPNLRELDLSENKLEELPDWIGEMTSLVALVVRGNRLSSLSPTIGNLSNLRHLSLSNNPLKTLPIEMKNLSDELQLYHKKVAWDWYSMPEELALKFNLKHLFAEELMQRLQDLSSNKTQ